MQNAFAERCVHRSCSIWLGDTSTWWAASRSGGSAVSTTASECR